jgi:hypothetical protein
VVGRPLGSEPRAPAGPGRLVAPWIVAGHLTGGAQERTYAFDLVVDD